MYRCTNLGDLLLFPSSSLPSPSPHLYQFLPHQKLKARAILADSNANISQMENDGTLRDPYASQKLSNLHVIMLFLFLTKKIKKKCL